ncbi:MAG: tRNA (guanosine(37)-N1)-methyltransferase TrmD [Oscillospiraceae bacterium]|nr:tRNA (guanosine(37)-N1)-methyltransferase TrmD [Oscillospiraceae bacterium]
MRIDIATLFPQMCETVLDESIIGRARRAGIIEINCHNIRDYTDDKHRRVDDTPYGGGKGMVMQAQPVYQCVDYIKSQRRDNPPVLFMSPAGKTLTQKYVCELAESEGFIVVCGHYEGIDQRVIDQIADDEISVGDYVLTGGELPALILADAVGRLCSGVLSDDECYINESFYSGMLEHSHYTRPEVWRGMEVPAVLLSGHHANIEKWRKDDSIRRTTEKRPDLL